MISITTIVFVGIFYKLVTQLTNPNCLNPCHLVLPLYFSAKRHGQVDVFLILLLRVRFAQGHQGRQPIAGRRGGGVRPQHGGKEEGHAEGREHLHTPGNGDELRRFAPVVTVVTSSGQ